MSRFAYAVLLVGWASAAPVLAAQECTYDEKALLALSEQAFDQDLSRGGQGWRALANVPGCELAAADLLAAYRRAHPDGSSVLLWHEGQMRASAGQYDRAIPLLEAARKPQRDDGAGWNLYVDATIAFLRGENVALRKARDELSTLPYPPNAGLPPLRDGYIEFPAQPGLPSMKMRWPPNIDAVERLVRCSDRPYRDAYGSPACGAPNH